ncbi:MAG TPA: hypothetical protein VK470_04505 [Bacteroidota bacterium]|nr:hypothetical protein [Bacteroidota bacterium]
MKTLLQRPSVLLDLDNTALIYQKDGSFTEHPKLRLILKHFRIIIYSARDDIEDFAKRWGVPYIWKGYDDLFPQADFLIDDQIEEYEPLVDVKKSYTSINRFVAAQLKPQKKRSPAKK